MLLAEGFDGLTTLLWIVGGLFALVYAGGPLMIYSSQRFEAEPTMEPFDPGEHAWPNEIAKLFTTSQAALEQEGFTLVGGMFLPSAVPNVKTALVLFHHPANRDGAMATAIYGMPIQPGSPRTLYVEFSTRFRDGAVFDTSNTQELGSFPPAPLTTSHALPTVTEARALYRIHRAVTAEHGSVALKADRLEEDFDGDAVRYLQTAMRESFEHAAAAGYVRLADDGGHYRPTAIGACLMVWKELWPWKPLRRALRNRRERALLHRLGAV